MSLPKIVQWRYNYTFNRRKAYTKVMGVCSIKRVRTIIVPQKDDCGMCFSDELMYFENYNGITNLPTTICWYHDRGLCRGLWTDTYQFKIYNFYPNLNQIWPSLTMFLNKGYPDFPLYSFIQNFNTVKWPNRLLCILMPIHLKLSLITHQFSTWEKFIKHE